jgi:chondroitin AC lyase
MQQWFFFDKEYVCLGSGISCTWNLSVVTTLNQCLLRDDVTVSKNNISTILENGEEEYENVDWVFQDGIGYAFPKPANVSIKNSQQLGSWWLINKQSSTPKREMKKDVFKLWIDHGKRPSDASYEYIVIPATTIEKMEKNSSISNINVLSNSIALQAVVNTELNIFQVLFYKSGNSNAEDRRR